MSYMYVMYLYLSGSPGMLSSVALRVDRRASAVPNGTGRNHAQQRHPANLLRPLHARLAAAAELTRRAPQLTCKQA